MPSPASYDSLFADCLRKIEKIRSAEVPPATNADQYLADTDGPWSIPGVSFFYSAIRRSGVAAHSRRAVIVVDSCRSANEFDQGGELERAREDHRASSASHPTSTIRRTERRFTSSNSKSVSLDAMATASSILNKAFNGFPSARHRLTHSSTMVSTWSGGVVVMVLCRRCDRLERIPTARCRRRTSDPRLEACRTLIQHTSA